jgi:hypothetical protein
MSECESRSWPEPPTDELEAALWDLGVVVERLTDSTRRVRLGLAEKTSLAKAVVALARMGAKVGAALDVKGLDQQTGGRGDGQEQGKSEAHAPPAAG